MKIEGNELIIGGVVASIDRDNIDTDQIIPTEYLKSIKKFGFEDYLFDGWRYLDEGKLGVSKNDREQNPDFILNQAPYDKATILLTRDNFGCGSSREHAAMEPRFRGCKVVIVKSFARIHEANLKKQGILPLTFDNKDDYNLINQEDKLTIKDPSNIKPDKQVIVDIEKPDGEKISIVTNHSLSEEQITWFKAGSALNYIKSN